MWPRSLFALLSAGSHQQQLSTMFRTHLVYKTLFPPLYLLHNRPISTSQVVCGRKKFNPYPEGVPSWANYDGNQKCIDGDRPDKLIWEGYKRNHKGTFPREKTRLRCKRGTKLCGNPCPICSRNITIEYTDASLLTQFICPHSGEILPAKRTGLCRQQQRNLEAAIEKALDCGLLPFTVPRRLPQIEPRTPPWNTTDIL